MENVLVFMMVMANSENDMLVFFVVIGMVILLGIGALIAYLFEQKRTKELEAMSKSMNLRFVQNGSDSLLNPVRAFHLFSQGHSRTIKNYMHGQDGETDLAVMDYRYVTGYGKSRHTYLQTVVIITSVKLDLPKFALRPENLLHKIGNAFGYQDIDFKSHPKFSNRYLLQGDHADAIRKLFNREILVHFETLKKVCVEGGGQVLVFYRTEKRVSPKEIKKLMDEGFRIFNLFVKTQSG